MVIENPPLLVLSLPVDEQETGTWKRHLPFHLLSSLRGRCANINGWVGYAFDVRKTWNGVLNRMETLSWSTKWFQDIGQNCYQRNRMCVIGQRHTSNCWMFSSWESIQRPQGRHFLETTLLRWPGLPTMFLFLAETTACVTGLGTPHHWDEWRFAKKQQPPDEWLCRSTRPEMHWKIIYSALKI